MYILWGDWRSAAPANTHAGLAYSDVAALFNPSGTCSLTTFAGIKVWMQLRKGGALTDLCPGVFTMSTAQAQLLLNWIDSYSDNIVSATLFATFSVCIATMFHYL